jgi:predicted RNA-binding Zn-ribbon protein involved in translation (DUF1610 family)
MLVHLPAPQILAKPLSPAEGEVPNLRSSYPSCLTCGDDIEPPARALITNTCKHCGEQAAITARKSWCVAPINKSNYMLFTDLSLLSQLNPKKTT